MMKKVDYVIILLLIIFSGGAEYLYLLAPKGVEITPIMFSDKEIYYQWFIWLLTNNIRLIIYMAIILISQKNKLHRITIDVVILSLIITIFEFIWLVLWYNNPFEISVEVIKLLAVIIIFVSIYSIRHLNGKHNNRTDNSILNGSDVLRSN